MAIPFTQYMRPYGHRHPTRIDVDQETEILAREVIAAGGKFEIEELRNGVISMECVNPAIEEGEPGYTLSSELCANGPMVTGAVVCLVHVAHKNLCPSEAGE